MNAKIDPNFRMALATILSIIMLGLSVNLIHAEKYVFAGFFFLIAIFIWMSGSLPGSGGK